MTTPSQILKQIEDLKTYPKFVIQHQDPLVQWSSYENGFCDGAQAGLAAIESWVRSRIEHDRGRG